MLASLIPPLPPLHLPTRIAVESLPICFAHPHKHPPLVGFCTTILHEPPWASEGPAVRWDHPQSLAMTNLVPFRGPSGLPLNPFPSNSPCLSIPFPSALLLYRVRSFWLPPSDPTYPPGLLWNLFPFVLFTRTSTLPWWASAPQYCTSPRGLPRARTLLRARRSDGIIPRALR